MKPRMPRILFPVLGFVVFLPVLYASENNSVYYVFNSDPKAPSISIVEKDNMKASGKIPLEAPASHAIMGPQNRHLYVLHNGVFEVDGLAERSGPSSLTIIDVASKQRLKSISLGWNVASMSISKDGRYLLCFSEGNPGNKKVRRENGAVHLVDTEKNDLAATLDLGKLGAQVLFTDDVSRIFVLSKGEPGKKKNTPPAVKPAVTIFSLDKEKPEAEIEFEFEPGEIVLSKDQKWLYVLERGSPSKNAKKNRNGSVFVIEVASGALVKTHAVGTSPVGFEVDANAASFLLMAKNSPKDNTGKVYLLDGAEIADVGAIGTDPQYVRRLGDQDGRMAFSFDEMRFIPDGALVSSSPIMLNRKKRSPSTSNASYLGGYPGETVYLPEQNKLAMTVLDAFKNPTSKIALVDLSTNTVERVVKTGRGGVKFGKFMGAMALSVAMTSLSYYGGYYLAQTTGSPYFFYNVYSYKVAPPNVNLVASPNGNYVYALNTQTNDVTVINVADGNTDLKIPVGGGSRRVLLAPGGRFVTAFANAQVTLIDITGKAAPVEHKLTSGKVINIHADEPNQRILALTTNSMLFWDSKTGKLLSTVEGLSKPTLIVERN